MKDLWFRLLVFWYRLTGSSPVQAEWRARQANAHPEEVREAAKRTVARTADRRFKCGCGQLMVAGDKVCGQCGRRHYAPFWLRRIARTLGLVMPARSPASILVGFLMAVGYFVQIRYGEGGLLDPHPAPGGMADLYELGASFDELTIGSQPWRAVTYTMLHGGLMHIVFNGFALLQIGPLVERVFGSARFLFGWVVAGALAVMLPPLLGFTSLAPTVGASGAVFGLMGMALVFGHRLGTSQGRYLRDVMVKWTIYITIFGFLMGGVAHGAHFGGLAAGILLGWLFPPVGQKPRRHHFSPFLGTAALGLLVAALVGFSGWFKGDRMPSAELSSAARQQVYSMLYHKYGIDQILGRDAVRILAEASEIGRGRHPGSQLVNESGLVNIYEKSVVVTQGMDPIQKAIFMQEIRRRLGIRQRPRPVDPYDDQE